MSADVATEMSTDEPSLVARRYAAMLLRPDHVLKLLQVLASEH